MRPISQFLLRKMFNDIPNLEKAIMCLDEECQDRFVEIVIGVDIDNSTLPKRIKRNNVIYDIKSANYLKNEITATYIGDYVRFFINQDDADEFAKTGNYNSDNSNDMKSGEYTIIGIHEAKKETYFSYNIWMNSEVVEE